MAFQTLAVLPFRNLTADPAEDYFSDGMTEAVMTELARFDDLRVTSRISSFALKGNTDDVRKIGQRLGVGFVVEGSVLKVQKQIRISAQLVSTATGFQIWSETFDREIDNILSLLNEIAGKIGQQLRIQLAAVATPSPPLPQTRPDAYNLYLKGNFHFYKFTPDHLRKSTRYFEQAIAEDPGFAPAYSSLANSLFQQGNFGYLKSSITYPRAKAAIEKALELDPSLALSHVVLAQIKMYFELNWKSAGISLAKALETRQEIPTVYEKYAWYLVGLGQFDRAISVMETALEYDPISPYMHGSLGDLCRYAGYHEKALLYFDKALDLEPNYRYALERKGYIQVVMGNFEKGIKLLHAYKKMVTNPLGGNSGLTCAYALAGREDKAREYLQQTLQLQKQEPERNLKGDLATIYCALGEIDQAMHYLEGMLNDRIAVISLLHEPLLAPLRKTRRFRELQKQYILEDGVQEASRFLVVSKTENRVTIKADVNDQLEIDPQQFLYAEAQDNYVRIVWQDNNLLKSKLMRISFNRLLPQFNRDFILRCHRSFLVNIQHRFSVTGNSRGYRLHSSFFNFEIPVSRSLASEVLNRLQNESS